MRNYDKASLSLTHSIGYTRARVMRTACIFIQCRGAAIFLFLFAFLVAARSSSTYRVCVRATSTRTRAHAAFQIRRPISVYNLTFLTLIIRSFIISDEHKSCRSRSDKYDCCCCCCCRLFEGVKDMFCIVEKFQRVSHDCTQFIISAPKINVII